jgi:hypothetical protein
MGIFPLEPLLVPVLFALPEGAGQLLVVPVRPIPLTSLSVHRSMRTADPSRWLTVLLAQEAPFAEPSSRFHSLLPRPIAGNRLALPVWAAVRLTSGSLGKRPIELEPPEVALGRIGALIDDPRFAGQVMASVRGTLASDPFAQRIVGDDARLAALSQEPLAQGPADGLPAVVALLPAQFTLGELQQAIAATLGLPPGAMETSSSFRRRLQEFVHWRVLREVPTPREASAERIGRPPRHYAFDPHGWRAWLTERGHRASAREAIAPMAPDVHAEAPDDDLRHLLHSREMPRASERLRMSRHSLADAAPAASREPPSPAPEDSRLARLEQMVAALARELGRRERTDR